MTKGKLWTKDFIIIFLVNLCLTMNFYLTMIVMSQFAITRFQASPAEAGFATGLFIIGILVARFFTGNLLGRVGTSAVLYAGVTLSLLTSALYFWATSQELLLLIRLLHGAAFGITSTAAGTIVANVLPRERVGEGIGYYGLSMTVASAIGPFLGLMLSQQGNYNLIFAICTAVSAVSVLLALFLSRRRLNPAHAVAAPMKGFDWSSFLEPKVLPIAAVCMVVAFFYSSVISFLAVYAKAINLMTAANYFFVVFSAVLFVSRPLVGRLFDRKGENLIFYTALVIFAAGMLTLSQAHHGISLLLAAALIGLGFSSIQSSGQAVAAKAAAPHRMGLATSTFFMLSDIGMGFGPFLLGMLIPVTGYRGMYLGAACALAASMGLYYVLHGRHVAARRFAVLAHS